MQNKGAPMLTMRQAIELSDICTSIIWNSKDPYAIAYARAGQTMTDPADAACQLLYIQANLGYWRGERAREIKARIKALHAQLTEEAKAA